MGRRQPIAWVFSLLMFGVLTCGASAQTTDTSAPGGPAAEFKEKFAELKELVGKLLQLQTRYRNDPQADKKALEAEFKAIQQQARELRTQLGGVAEQVYQAAPNQDTDVNEFLFDYLYGLVSTDDFEPAAKISQTLSQHGYQHDHFDRLAGLAFFATNDFAAAEKHLKAAMEKGQGDQLAQSSLAAASGKHPELWKKEQEIRAAEAKADNLPRVQFSTSKGDIVIELFENEAPIATANSISLVEKNFYDGINFHRVLPNFMAQGGDPKGDGSGGPGYTIPDECDEDDHRKHFRGSLSMAKTAAPDSGGSQFFLCFLPTPHLDGKHTVFGRVIEGMDVLAKLQRCQPGDGSTPDKIVKATVLRKRDHAYEPLKYPEK